MEWTPHPRDSYAHLREPEGDSYQAFVIQEPSIESCTPYFRPLAAGCRDDNAATYDVTIPGVQPLTGEIWGNAPAVVIDDPNYQAWYVGLPTAITAEHVDGGNPLGHPGVDYRDHAVGETEAPGELRLVNSRRRRVSSSHESAERLRLHGTHPRDRRRGVPDHRRRRPGCAERPYPTERTSATPPPCSPGCTWAKRISVGS